MVAKRWVTSHLGQYWWISKSATSLLYCFKMYTVDRDKKKKLLILFFFFVLNQLEGRMQSFTK